MSFDMNMVIERLNRYTENELAYKEYYEINGNRQRLEQFAKKHPQEEALRRRLILPDLYPDSVPWEDFFCDENLFSAGRNVRLWKHDRYTPAFLHSHDVFEMNYVLSGGCRQKIGEKEITFHTGDICFIALNVPHTIEVFDESIVINILIRRDTFDDIFLTDLRSKTLLTTFFLDSLYQNDKTDFIIFHTGDDVVIRDMILEMCMETHEEDVYADNLLTHMTSILFSKLMRGYADTAMVSQRRSREFYDQIEIVGYLQNHYQTATLAETAEHFGYNMTYCSKLIKKTTGTNFVQLLREIRMKQAERLLRGTPASIEKIAERVGYENAGTFIRVFKQSRGMTPSQYRSEKTVEPLI